jgi:hypothetical protein
MVERGGNGHLWRRRKETRPGVGRLTAWHAGRRRIPPWQRKQQDTLGLSAAGLGSRSRLRWLPGVASAGLVTGAVSTVGVTANRLEIYLTGDLRSGMTSMMAQLTNPTMIAPQNADQNPFTWNGRLS